MKRPKLLYTFLRRGTARVLWGETNDIHRRARAILKWTVVCGVTAILLNLIGLKVANFYLAILVNILMIMIMTRPSVLLAVGAAGAATSPREPLKSGKEMLKKAADVYAHALLYTSLFFLFAGIFSFRNNPIAVPMIVAALLVAFWMDRAVWFKAKYHRKAIYVFANAVVVFGVMSFIPRSGYIKVVGFYPYSFLTTTALEDKVSAVEEVERKTEEKTKISQLAAIEKKMKDGQKLTAEEKDFWEDQKKKRDEAKLFNRVSSTFHSTEAEALVSPKVTAVSEITLKKGDELVYELGSNEATPWILVPTGVNYNIHPQMGGHYRVYYWGGKKVDVGDKDVGLPDICPVKFKIIPKTAEVFVVSGI
jgi:hypothetical protein